MASTPCRLTRLVHQYALQTKAQNTFSAIISKRLELVGTSDALRKSSFQFPLHQCDCHPFAMPSEGHHVHSGVVSTVMEDITTMHICAMDERERRAVTTEMSMSFLGVCKIGRTLQIDSELVKVGGQLAVAQAEVKDLDSGRTVAVGRHCMMFVGGDGGASRFSTMLNSCYDV
mmetsp:Transcript_40236/g.92505  ORF Transcript_40236/g.92505 Transcript_40236/m.92505 type:complete len:173 (+) Transcript_40236:109-627(+)